MLEQDDERESDSWQNSNNFVKHLDRKDRVRLSKLIIEGLEVSLHLCNTFLSSFGPMRLVDVLEQILPTAYLLNTSYWPLYRTDKGYSTCVCSMFDISCPHSSEGLTWVQLDRPVNESVIFKDGTENITLTDLSVVINTFVEKQFCIDFNSFARYKLRKIYEIELKFKSKSLRTDGTNEYSDSIKVQLWFKFVKSKSNFDKLCLWNAPHPIFTPIYGRHFSCLLDNLVSLSFPGSLFLSWCNCPKYTIIITGKIFSKYFETLTMKEVGLEED